MPVVQHLLRFGLVLVLPIVVLVGIGLWRYADGEADRYAEDVRRIARELARDLDRDLLDLKADLSEAPLPPDGAAPPSFVFDRAGNPLDGRPAPAPVVTLAAAAARDDRFLVSDIYPPGADETGGGDGGNLRVAVALPRRSNGEVAGAAVAEVAAEHFRSLIVASAVPDGWAAALVDRSGRIVARLTRHVDLVGKPATQAFRDAAVRDSGNWEGLSQDGIWIIGGYARSTVSGWYAAAGVPKETVFAPLRRSLLVFGAFGIAVLALAAGLAVLFGRQISRPICALADAARELTTGRFSGLPPTRVTEVNQVAEVLAFAQAGISAREAERARLRETEERLRLAQEAAKIGIHDYDVVSGIIRWDARTREIWAVGSDVPIDFRLFLDSLHPEDRAEVERAVAEALDPTGPGDYAIEYRIIGINDGIERWVAATGRVHFADGRAVRLVGTVEDITGRKAAAEREQLLAHEVEHRARNVLAVARSLIRQTPFGDHASFIKALEARLAALDRVQALLSRDHWTKASLRSILEDELAVHGERILLSGPPVWLSAAAAQPFVMVIHELTTNAAKYGGLAAAGGRLSVTWTETDRALRLVWREEAAGANHDGAVPTDAPPPGGAVVLKAGFGGKLIDLAIGRQLLGTIDRTWDTQGLIVTIELPARCLAGPARSAGEEADGDEGGRDGLAASAQPFRV